MADIGRVDKRDGQVFPLKRRSVDPLQPENPEIEFGEELRKFDDSQSTVVQGTERSEHTVIREDKNRKTLKKRPGMPRKGGAGESAEEDEEPEEEKIIDLEA